MFCAANATASTGFSPMTGIAPSPPMAPQLTVMALRPRLRTKALGALLRRIPAKRLREPAEGKEGVLLQPQ